VDTSPHSRETTFGMFLECAVKISLKAQKLIIGSAILQDPSMIRIDRTRIWIQIFKIFHTNS
jgi:hypothetical protein